MIAVSLENIILVVSILLFFSIIAGKTGYRFGVPALLLFLCVGMLAGSDGILKIHFNNPATTQLVGMIALSIILFSGGMDTKFNEIRPIFPQGIILSTIGVLFTALITGFFIYWLTNTLFENFTFSLPESLLLASIMASTDSASVFSVLRSKGLNLKYRLRPMLEFESGSNDPMAYMLMVVFLQLTQIQDCSFGTIVWTFFYQMIVGGIVGFLLGKLSVKVINRINLANAALYPVLLLTIALMIFSFTNFIKGNGYLAVYLGGMIIGNSKIIHKRISKSFFDGFAWLSQIVMFLTLGLLVNPSELLPVAGIGLLIGVFMILFSRPIAVALSLLPFWKMNRKAKTYISWVGLRGAVPIIFATYPLMAGIEQAHNIFNIVFFITIISLLVQGTSVSFVARKLGLVKKRKNDLQFSVFDVEFSEDIKSIMAELIVTEEVLHGDEKIKLINFPLPENTLVVMIKRRERYFVPDGHSEIFPNDILLIISDTEEALEEISQKLQVPIIKDDL